MTVDEVWVEARKLLEKKAGSPVALREILAALVHTPEGRFRLCRELDLKFSGMMALLRQLAVVLDPKGECSSRLNDKDRGDLLEAATKAARGHTTTHAAYWAFMWLRLKNGTASIASDVAKDLKNLNEGCRSPHDLAKRLTTLQGWTDFPKDQWVELLDKARAAELSAELRTQIQKVVESLRSGGAQPVPKLPASPPPPTVPGVDSPAASGQRSPEPQQAKTATRPHLTATAAEGERPRAPEATVRAKPADNVQPRSDEPPVPNAAVEEKAGTGQPKSPEQSAPVPATPQAAGKLVTPDEGIPDAVLTAANQEACEVKDARPRRAVARKTGSKELAAGATPRTDPATSDAPAATGSSESAKSTSAGSLQAAIGGEFPAVLTELTSAVLAMSERFDQLASRAGDGASLVQRLVELERRLAGVERALTETQTDAQRSREEVESLRSHIRQKDQELADAVRERDAAAARADDLAGRLALADARINAAEIRADQNIHEAFRERDAAVLTFKARLWDAVQAQLSDVTDAAPGEEFASTEEEVLTTRLRRIRDTLRSEGVPP